MAQCAYSWHNIQKSTKSERTYRRALMGAALRGLMLVDKHRLPSGRPRLRLGIVTFLGLEALVLAQALFAYQGGFLTASQMQLKGVASGLPFLWHFGMWGDALVVSLLSALVVAYYSKQWTPASVALSGVVGLAVSGVMHWMYSLAAMPEAHIHAHQLTQAGMAHLIYMALVLTIFLQFFLFTPHLTARTLGVVSALVFIHVLAGTHIALGVLALLTPLEWYPGRPLESVIGWLIIALLAVGLLWRNFGFGIFKRFFNWYLYWTGNNISNTEGLFKFLSEICRVVAIWTYVGVTGQIVYRHWNGKIFDLGGFLSEGFLQCVLVALVGMTYWLGQLSVKQEIAIAKTIFSPGKIPRDWGTPQDRWATVILVLGFCALYLVIAYVSQYILIVSGLMTILAANDYHTRYKINEGINKYFSDDRYSPRPEEEDYFVVLARRKEVCDFLFVRPHLMKEILRTAGCATSFLIAGAAYLYQEPRLETCAYLVLIATLLINEVITVRWRLVRDSRLRDVDERAGKSRMLA